MSRWEIPSFSSSLLDKIYRSIDEGERIRGEVKSYDKTAMPRRHRKTTGRDVTEEEDTAALRRACLIEKWMEKKASKKSLAELVKDTRKLDKDHDDGVFFSSNTCSSDSSSGGFSWSDAESMYGSRPGTASSCFKPSLWPKPIRTSVGPRPVKTEEKRNEKKKKQSALLQEQQQQQQREFCMVDDYCHSRRISDQTTKKVEEATMKPKSRALKLYDNLKKVKQPISPGGRVANFINSLLSKKIKSSSSASGYEETERRIYSVHGSTCSSASSFSRSCLSKHSPITREKLRNGIKKSVKFYPVIAVVGEKSRPCAYKEEDAHLMPVTVPTAWKIGRSQSRKTEDGIVELRVVEKSRQAEEAAKEYLRDHPRNQVKNESLFNTDYENDDDVNDMEDDASSCSSSDLFELDHLAFAGKERYREELPVYETTRVNSTNRAIF